MNKKKLGTTEEIIYEIMVVPVVENFSRNLTQHTFGSKNLDEE